MKKKYGILSIIFLLLALLGAVLLVKNEQDIRNKATHYGNCNGVGELSCNTLSGSAGGYSCSAYKSCHQQSGYDDCDPIPGSNQCIYLVNGVQCVAQCPGTIPSGYMRCHCNNGVWTIGQGANCAGLCACTGNDCTNCTPTPTPGGSTPTPPRITSTPTPPRITSTPTPTITPSPTSTPTPGPSSTPTPGPSSTPTPGPTVTPTPTPTPTSTPTPIPTSTPTPIPTSTPTPIPTSTPTPTPTSVPNVCGGTCGSNSNCQSDYVCYQGYCRNPSCTNNVDCICPGEPNLCGGTCGSNVNCKSGLFCYQGYCRNSSCPSQENCLCSQGQTPTPTDALPINTPVPTMAIAEGPTPTRIILPQSGVEFPSQILTIIGGIITLLGFLILL